MEPPKPTSELHPRELEQIGVWLETSQNVSVSEEMYDLIAERWPQLLARVVRTPVYAH